MYNGNEIMSGRRESIFGLLDTTIDSIGDGTVCDVYPSTPLRMGAEPIAD